LFLISSLEIFQFSFKAQIRWHFFNCSLHDLYTSQLKFSSASSSTFREYIIQPNEELKIAC
jgi:hypothetical protein